MAKSFDFHLRNLNINNTLRHLVLNSPQICHWRIKFDEMVHNFQNYLFDFLFGPENKANSPKGFVANPLYL